MFSASPTTYKGKIMATKSLKAYKRQTATFKKKVLALGEYENVPIDVIWKEDYEALDDAFYVSLAAIIYRKRARAYKKLVEAVTKTLQGCGTIKGGEIPFFCAAPRAGYVYVYPNLKSIKNISDYGYYSELTIFTDSDDNLLTHVYETVNAGIKCKDKKFSGDKRISSFIRKRESLTTAKFLTRYIFQSDSTSSSIIRDFAEKLNNELLPAVLTFCETKQQCIQWYEGGTSKTCMTMESSYSDPFKALFKKEGFHPGFFYLHTPQLKPVMVVKSDKVVARTLLHRADPDEKWTHYGVVYCENGGYSTILTDLLSELGISERKIIKKHSYKLTCDFDIPGVWSDERKDYIAPIPYLDTMPEYDYSKVAFDIPSKTFKFLITEKAREKNKNPSKKIGWRTWDGCLCAKDIFFEKECSYCGDIVRNATYRGRDDVIFCCKEHMVGLGYCQAKQADGAYIIIHKNEAYKDPCKSGIFFTTPYAAKKHGGLPFISRLGSEVDHDVVTVYSGHKVIYKSEKCSIASYLHNILGDGRAVQGWKMRNPTGDEDGNYYVIEHTEPKKVKHDAKQFKIDW